jgi:hypothetical protein
MTLGTSTDPFPLLCLFSAAAGLFLILAATWLLYKGRIYIDSTTKQPTSFELPFGVKLQTQAPTLVLFMIGAALLFYPIDRARRLVVDQIQIDGAVDSDSFPVEVHAVVTSENVHQAGKFTLSVPRLADAGRSYKVLYLASGSVFDQTVDPSKVDDGRRIPIAPISIQVPDQFKR